MLKSSKLLLIAAALVGSTALATATENDNGVSMYIPSYGSDAAWTQPAPKAKRNFGAEEKVLFDHATRLD